MIDICIVSYKRFPFTKMCLEYLKERTKSEHRVILIDNGSGSEIQKRLVSFRDKGFIDHLVLLNENYGIHAGWNIATAVASTDFYVTMDNDILVPDLEPDWLCQLELLMKKYSEYLAISCQPHQFVGRSPLPTDQGEIVQIGHAGAHARIMRRKDIKRLGGWKDVYNSKRNDEEKTIARKIYNDGKKVGYARDLTVYHLFSENWGYNDMPIEEHGHREIWPPPEMYDKFDKLDHKTWKPKLNH